MKDLASLRIVSALCLASLAASCELAPAPAAESGWSGASAPFSQTPTVCHDFVVAPGGDILAAFAAYEDGQRLTVVRRGFEGEGHTDAVLGSRAFSERLVSEVKIGLDGSVPCVAWLEADELEIMADVAGERPESDRLVYARFEDGAWRRAAVIQRDRDRHFKGFNILGGKVYAGMSSDTPLPGREYNDRFAVYEMAAEGTVRDLGALTTLFKWDTRFCRFFMAAGELFAFWYGPSQSTLFDEYLLVKVLACDPSLPTPVWREAKYAAPFSGFPENYVPIYFDGAKAVSFGVNRSSYYLEFPTRSYGGPDFSAADSTRMGSGFDWSVNDLGFFAACSDGGRIFVAVSDGTCPNPYRPFKLGGGQDETRFDVEHGYDTGRESVFELAGGSLVPLGPRGFSGGGVRDCSLKIEGGRIYASYVDAAFKYGLVIAWRDL